MSSGETDPSSELPIWKLAVSAAPVGIGVVAFLAVQWPLDLAVLAVLIGIAIVLGRVIRGSVGALNLDTMLLYAFLFLTLFTAAGSYLVSSVYQVWLPVPVLIACGALAGVLGAAWLLAPKVQAYVLRNLDS